MNPKNIESTEPSYPIFRQSIQVGWSLFKTHRKKILIFTFAVFFLPQYLLDYFLEIYSKDTVNTLYLLSNQIQQTQLRSADIDFLPIISEFSSFILLFLTSGIFLCTFLGFGYFLFICFLKNLFHKNSLSVKSLFNKTTRVFFFKGFLLTILYLFLYGLSYNFYFFTLLLSSLLLTAPILLIEEKIGLIDTLKDCFTLSYLKKAPNNKMFSLFGLVILFFNFSVLGHVVNYLLLYLKNIDYEIYLFNFGIISSIPTVVPNFIQGIFDLGLKLVGSMLLVILGIISYSYYIVNTEPNE